MSASVHLVATVIWGIWAIVVGAIAIWTNAFGQWVSIATIVAIVGNSTHLISMAWSQKGLTVSALQASTQPPDISGRQVVNASGQVVGTIK